MSKYETFLHDVFNTLRYNNYYNDNMKKLKYIIYSKNESPYRLLYILNKFYPHKNVSFSIYDNKEIPQLNIRVEFSKYTANIDFFFFDKMDEESIINMKCMEISGAYIEENFEIYKLLVERSGRFPSRDCGGIDQYVINFIRKGVDIEDD